MSGEDINELRRRMTGAMEAFKKELGGLRTGRASVSLLEPLHVEAYGSNMPMTQVGTVNAPGGAAADRAGLGQGLVKSVEKAIRDANLGLNPQVDGQLIRVPLPALTEDRRKELIKVAHKYAEQARIAVRNVRRDGMEALKTQEKSHKITEDEHRKQGAGIQTLTDEFIKKIDEAMAAKEKDIMHV